jgi:hypothetical protein
MPPTQLKRVLRYIGNREKPEPELYDSLERYIHSAYPSAFALRHGGLREFSKHVPNPLFSDMTPWEGSAVNLLVPKYEQPAGWPWISQWSLPPAPVDPTEPKRIKRQQIPESEFEVNLAEPLIGWKAWYFDDKFIWTTGRSKWIPGKPFEALCLRDDVLPHRLPSPIEACTCGIYASTRSKAEENGEVVGEVYGWGRYVRGDKGWRAQYAYPKAFYLNYRQARLIEPLQKYHVPIFIDEPMRIYDPSEEGYGGYWENEADGNCGAHQVSDAGEAGSAGEED